MKTRKRIGSVIPIESVHPQEGSFLDYGVIVAWEDEFGERCARKQARYAIVEPSGKKFGGWNNWCEEHAWPLITLDEFEAAQDKEL